MRSTRSFCKVDTVKIEHLVTMALVDSDVQLGKIGNIYSFGRYQNLLATKL